MRLHTQYISCESDVLEFQELFIIYVTSIGYYEIPRGLSKSCGKEMMSSSTCNNFVWENMREWTQLLGS